MICPYLSFLTTILTKEEIVEMAEIILEAQRIHEESWVKEFSRYSLTMKQAAEKALHPHPNKTHYLDLIADFNGYYWNDVQSWAEEIIRSKGEMK